MSHILSTNQFSQEDFEKIISTAGDIEMSLKAGNVSKKLTDKVIACIFFEPSTRTRLSFETAALKLGASIISAEDALENSSAHKGETIEDTARILSAYADAIVMRHPTMGAVDKAASVTGIPIINAGDGANQHPSQGLLDLYTIKKEHGRLDNLTFTFVGDLINSRTLHSLLPLLLFYPNNTYYFVSPKELSISEEYRNKLKEKNVRFFETDNLEDVLPVTDVLYMTRVQKERFSDLSEYDKVKDAFLLKIEHMKLLKEKAIIMHPLPRVNEIDPQIDQDSRAAYFRQAENGLYVRMALLLYVFNL